MEPDWIELKGQRTVLGREYARRLVEFHGKLSDIAYDIAPDDPDHPLWLIMDSYHDVLGPSIVRPGEATGEWTLQELQGCLGDVAPYRDVERFYVCEPEDAPYLTFVRAVLGGDDVCD